MMSNMMGNQQQPNIQKNSQEFEDLEPYIDKSKIQCLNQDDKFPLDSALFDKSSNIYLKSECDQQLVIQLGFNAPVKIHHMNFRVPNIDDSAPEHIRLFVNQQNLDFDSCENFVCAQEFDLTNEDFKSSTLLRYVKFQSVNHLTVKNKAFVNILYIIINRFLFKVIEELNKLKFLKLDCLDKLYTKQI
ncbi:hypothetical protein IMG5_174950 [Ichthyophthirius multifiliis]|uniref:PITH domain-containing protein n=1 Tax=Ichthyophthirius multifiliis TaxID=5932 RepID=G0R249_ICHMU|nr:hypothetical protein IMG5_174950 [Ichthyophthirius multifiliis]EGR28456.1 hypothetical protein IMG5_174950 [Ichthyophthirius multifiliis]|eukprot:XP_004029692.1 hypothetical protein IMG5_174950 [Ichthyophthirius multifiliis]